MTPLQMLVMSFFPGIVVVLNIVLMVSGGSEVPSMMNMMLTFGLTIAVLIHLGIVQMVNDQMLLQQTLMVEAVRQKKSAEALLESYKTQRRLTHEFTNHTEALALLLQQGDYEGAKAYLSTLTKTIAANTTIMNTHNPLLDALLSKKYEEASRKGVMVYFDLPDLRDMPMGQTDLVIVLSNLLNNAIEAAAQAAPPEVYVRDAEERGRGGALCPQPGEKGPEPRGRSAAPHLSERSGPRLRAVERAGCAEKIRRRIYHQLPGVLVPLYLHHPAPQVMT